MLLYYIFIIFRTHYYLTTVTGDGGEGEGAHDPDERCVGRYAR